MAIACSSFAFEVTSIFGNRWSFMDEVHVTAEDALEEDDAVVLVDNFFARFTTFFDAIIPLRAIINLKNAIHCLAKGVTCIQMDHGLLTFLVVIVSYAIMLANSTLQFLWLRIISKVLPKGGGTVPS